MNYLYYSSVKSPLCQQAFLKMKQYPQLFNAFTKVDVSDLKVKIPPYLKEVPTLLIKTQNGQYNQLSGQAVINWITQWETANKPKQPTSSSPQQPVQQQQQPPKDDFEKMFFDPAMSSGAFSGAAMFDSADWKELPPMNDGTGTFTLLQQTGQQSQQISGGSGGGTQLPPTIETKEGSKKDEMKKRMEELQAQRDMEVPGTIKREG